MAEVLEKPTAIPSDAEPKRVKVKLKKPHSHAGVVYDEDAVKAGVDIEISEAQAKVLKDLGVIQ